MDEDDDAVPSNPESAASCRIPARGTVEALDDDTKAVGAKNIPMRPCTRESLAALADFYSRTLPSEAKDAILAQLREWGSPDEECTLP